MKDKTCILLVDDEPHFLLSLELLLKKQGYHILGTASNGPDALEILRTNSPDIILTDMGLSGELTGKELAHAIRKHWETPIIFITGYTDDSLEQKLADIEDSSFMTKPIEIESLVAEINKLTSKR